MKAQRVHIQNLIIPVFTVVKPALVAKSVFELVAVKFIGRRWNDGQGIPLTSIFAMRDRASRHRLLLKLKLGGVGPYAAIYSRHRCQNARRTGRCGNRKACLSADYPALRRKFFLLR